MLSETTSLRQNVFTLIKKHKYDIILLQDTHRTDELQTDILREWEGKILFNNFDATAHGTAILFHPNFIFKNHNLIILATLKGEPNKV